MAAILKFPERPIDHDAVGLHRDEPCLLLILPVVRVERCEGDPGRRGRRRRRDHEPNTRN